jgi:hypothetical protein
VEAPEIDGELSRYGDDGFLARGSGGFGSSGEEVEALLHGRVVGLNAWRDSAPLRNAERTLRSRRSGKADHSPG